MLNKPTEIYITTANVDMRKGLDGFVSMVEQQFGMDTMTGAMFVFHNRHCEKIKVFYWDGDGYCLLYKRKEYGKFRFPKHISGDTFSVTPECGSEMTVIGTDSFLQVEYISARISVEKHIRQKAVCKKDKAVFNTAKAPHSLIEGSFMTSSLLSHIICEKYVKSVPLRIYLSHCMSFSANIL